MAKDLKFNSAICTSRSQSKKLLALGLKKETADMSWSKVRSIETEGVFEWICVPLSIHANTDTEIPAWSLHRLMEIVMRGDKLGCITHNIHQNNVATYYELVISSIEHLIKIDEFNQDYLEEK